MTRTKHPARAALLLALTLAGSSAGCIPDCENNDPSISGVATFEGTEFTFDEGTAVLYMKGTPEDPCISSVSVSARGEDARLSVSFRPPEGEQAPLLAYTVLFSDYRNYAEDEPELMGEFDLRARNDDCGAGRGDFAASSVRMYLEASDDSGPYILSDVDLSVDGALKVSWLDESCE